MSIASEITNLTTDRNNIRTALVNKGVSAASSHGFDSFANDINNIPTGSTSMLIMDESEHAIIPGGTYLCTGLAAGVTFVVNKRCKCAYLCVERHDLMTYKKGWCTSGGTQGVVYGNRPGSSATEDVITNGDGSYVTKFKSFNIGYDSILTLSHWSGEEDSDAFYLSKTKDTYGSATAWYAYPIEIVFIAEDGDYVILPINIGAVVGCFSSDTAVTLADGSKKMAKDITYDDLLLCWDFDNGCQCSAKPLWIKKPEIAPMYQLVKLKSGKEIKFIGPMETGNCHRIFCTDTNRFEYVPNMIGKHTIVNGVEDIVESWYWVPQEIEYTNIVSDYHMCIYTNDILTSCRRSNVYPIENMKYIKDDRVLRTIDDYDNVPVKFFNGLRLAEQTRDVTEISFYVENMLRGMK